MEARRDVLRPPIPEPNPPAEDGARFLQRFWPPYLCGMTWAVPVLLLLLLPLKPTSVSLGTHLIMSALACLGGAIAGALASAVMCAVMPTVVNAQGIRSQDFWGRKRSLSWDEPIHIRPRRILNLRYLTLRPEHGGVFWLPLFLRDAEGFRAAVQRHAPPGHALIQALSLARRG